MAIFNLPMATLTDLDAPVITGTTVGTSTTIREDTGVDSYLTTFLTASPVASFAIVSNPGNLFAIAIDGDLTVNGALDYETASSHTLNITATDFVGLTSSPFTYTVNLSDIDENPPIVTLDATASNLTSINEFVTTDTLVATFDAVDNDNGGTVLTTTTARQVGSTFTLDPSTGRFGPDSFVSGVPDLSLSGSPNADNFILEWEASSAFTGQIKLFAKNSGQLGGGVPDGDPSATSSITLTIGVADTEGNYGYATYPLTLNQFPDPAVFTPVQLQDAVTTISATENTPMVTAGSTQPIARYTAFGTTPFAWSLSGPQASYFAISNTGEVTVANSLDYEIRSTYEFSVRVTNTTTGQDYFEQSDVTLTLANDPLDDPFNVEIGSNMDGVMNEDRIRNAGKPLGAIGGRLFTTCWYNGGSDDGFTFNVFCEIDPTTGDLTVKKQLPNADISTVESHMITRYSQLWARWYGYSGAGGLIALSRNGGFSLKPMLYDQTIDRDDQTNGRFWGDGRFLDPEDQNFWGYYERDRTWMNFDTQGRKVGSLRYKLYRSDTPERAPNGGGITVGPYFYTQFYDPDDNRSNLNCYIRPTAQTLDDGTAFDFVGHAEVRFPFSTNRGYVEGMAVIGTTLYLTATSTNFRTRLASFSLPNPNDPLAELTGM